MMITGFLQSLTSLGWLVFHLCLVSISFGYTPLNSMSVEFPCKHKWGKSKSYNYVIRRPSGSCESITQWLDQVDRQSSTSWITWINESLIHFSKQIAPNKWQACRMKILSLTLSFSDTDSDEKGRYQDLYHRQLLKHQ